MLVNRTDDLRNLTITEASEEEVNLAYRGRRQAGVISRGETGPRSKAAAEGDKLSDSYLMPRTRRRLRRDTEQPSGDVSHAFHATVLFFPLTPSSNLWQIQAWQKEFFRIETSSSSVWCVDSCVIYIPDQEDVVKGENNAAPDDQPPESEAKMGDKMPTEEAANPVDGNSPAANPVDDDSPKIVPAKESNAAQPDESEEPGLTDKTEETIDVKEDENSSILNNNVEVNPNDVKLVIEGNFCFVPLTNCPFEEYRDSLKKRRIFGDILKYFCCIFRSKTRN